MALSTIGTNSIADDAVGNTKLDLTANYAFTGTVTGAGKILQVKQTVLSSVYTKSSPANETFSEITGLSVTITPTSSSSKFLLMMSVACDSNNNYPIGLHFYRDSTKVSPNGPTIDSMASYVAFQQPGDTRAIGVQQNAQFLDTPNTASEITYKIFAAKPAASTSVLAINELGGCSSHTVYEIGA